VQKILSLVVHAVSEITAIGFHANLLNKLDFQTFGLQIIATDGSDINFL
jgi:hypothetical protein